MTKEKTEIQEAIDIVNLKKDRDQMEQNIEQVRQQLLQMIGAKTYIESKIKELEAVKPDSGAGGD